MFAGKEGNKDFEEVQDQVNQRSFMQQIKSKKANTSLKVINKAEFIAVANAMMTANDGEETLTEDQIKMFEPLLLLNQKITDLYQTKHLLNLLLEVSRRADSQLRAGGGQEAVNFNHLESDDEDKF